MPKTEQLDGVVIGMFLGFENDKPLVVFAGNPKEHAIVARSLTQMSPDDSGCEVALMFEDGQRERPLIVGRLVEPARKSKAATVISEGQTLRVQADERLELRVGKASIILEQDGRITIRGSQVTTQASGANRLRGGSIHLN